MLWYGLANNHGFADGNKRTATHTMECFLALNNIQIECSQTELSDIAVLVGDNKMQQKEIAKWIEDNSFEDSILSMPNDIDRD